MFKTWKRELAKPSARNSTAKKNNYYITNYNYCIIKVHIDDVSSDDNGQDITNYNYFIIKVHIDDVSSDDNGQDLANYNFASDGFRVNPANPEVSSNFATTAVYDKMLLESNFSFQLLASKHGCTLLKPA